MSNVLYRKYRPQRFAQVLGQDIIKTIIQNAIRFNKLAHAYLFCGPRGVGKTTVARLLAKAVNCLNPQEGEPDTTCENCVMIQEGRFLDLLEIDAASYTGVDNIREIIDHVKFAPNYGKYKVFIIDEVHMLSKAAFNALLKTLEEPPLHAIFILATTEIHKIPPTIISRSQRFDFKRVRVAYLLKLLEMVLEAEKLKIAPEAQVLLAQVAEGSFRDLLSILDQLRSLGKQEFGLSEIEEVLGLARVEVNQTLFDYLLKGEAQNASQFIKDLSHSGKDLVQFSRNFLEYLRMVLLVKMGVEDKGSLGLSEDEAVKLSAQSAAISGGFLLEIIKAFLEAHRETKQSPVPELPLLVQILTLTQKVTSLQEISNPLEIKPPQDLDLGTVVDRWAEVLAKMKEYNHSLLSSLRLGRLVRLEGQDLVMAFPYNFHKETIEARKNRIVVEQVLEDIFAERLKVKVVLERELANENSSPDLLGEAIKVLGE